MIPYQQPEIDFMRKSKHEPLPWYRQKSYRGTMPEAVKRELDAFRMRPEHPATRYDELPTEVQNYIGKLEMSVYDAKQERAAAAPLMLTAFFAYTLYSNFSKAEPLLNWTSTLLGLAAAASWVYYRIEWRRNANAFLPNDNPVGPTNEAIKVQWEIEYLVNRRDSD